MPLDPVYYRKKDDSVGIRKMTAGMVSVLVALSSLPHDFEPRQAASANASIIESPKATTFSAVAPLQGDEVTVPLVCLVYIPSAVVQILLSFRDLDREFASTKLGARYFSRGSI